MVAAETSVPPLLEFAAATLLAEWPAYRALRQVNLKLNPGDLALVRVEADDAPLPLAPAAQGLIEPTGGDVRFEGHVWMDDDVALEAQLRSRIGRVFDGWGWISNLSVLENVTLSQRHHTSRLETEIEVEADRWSQRFGLAQTPRGRPANLPVDVLRRAEWARAFMSQPRLILLEHPTRGAPGDSYSALVAAVHDARQGGAGVIWIAADGRTWHDAALRPSQRWQVVGEELRPGAELQA